MLYSVTGPVYKLLGNSSATLDFFGNFQLVEQLSVHWATFRILFLDNHSHATSETIKKVQNIACVENTFDQSFSFSVR